MKRILLVLAPLPLLTACGEVEIPFVAPVEIEIPELDAPDEDGVIRLVEASEMKSLDDLRAEMPEELDGLQDFTLTGLSIMDPEPMMELEDGEVTEEPLSLGDYALEVRVFLSTDQERSDDDMLLAVVEDFSSETGQYEAIVTDAAQLSRYEEGGFALITEADLIEVPPAHVAIPMTVRGFAVMEGGQALTGQ